MIDTISILGIVLASTGLWSFMIEVYRRRCAKKDDERIKLIKRATSGLLYIGMQMSAQAVFRRGYIDPQELHDIEKYMYEPYHALGGNGSAEALMKKLEALPFEKGDE